MSIDTEMIVIGPETRQICRKLRNQKVHILDIVSDKHIIKPLTERWHIIRGKLLTASDMAAVLGENKYCSESQLFLRKTNQTPGFTGNIFTRHGQMYEQEAADVYTQLTGLELTDPQQIGLVFHPYAVDGCKRYGATPDFVTKTGILIEVKCPLTRTIQHTLPKLYYAQVQMQLACFPMAKCLHFVQYKPSSFLTDGVFDIVVVERDNGWFERNLETFNLFWERVAKYYAARGLVLGERTKAVSQGIPRKMVLSRGTFEIV